MLKRGPPHLVRGHEINPTFFVAMYSWSKTRLSGVVGRPNQLPVNVVDGSKQFLLGRQTTKFPLSGASISVETNQSPNFGRGPRKIC